MASSCVCPFLSVCAYVCVCVCVCVSATLRYCIKKAKRRITQIMPHDRPGTQMGCFVVAEFLLISASPDPSAIADFLVVCVTVHRTLTTGLYVSPSTVDSTAINEGNSSIGSICHRICCKVRCITYRQQIDQVDFEHYSSNMW